MVDLKEISEAQVKDSVLALKSFLRKEAGGKQLLLEDEETVFLVFSVKKLLPVPDNKWKILRVVLPHMVAGDVPSVCLFVKDLERKGRNTNDDKAIWHFKELLADHNIKEINEIITLHMLRGHYKPFETKRHLADSYDVFFADSRIYGYLPKLLGREFLRKKQLPIKLNLSSKTLQKDVSVAMHTASVRLSRLSSSYHLKIGHTGFSDENLVANILATCESLKKYLPGGWLNVRSLHVKTDMSPSIPIFISQESGNSIEFLETEVEVKHYEDELSTLSFENKVSVYLDGGVQIKRLMDEDEDDDNVETAKPDENVPGDKDSGRESDSEAEEILEKIETNYVAKRKRRMEKNS